MCTLKIHFSYILNMQSSECERIILQIGYYCVQRLVPNDRSIYNFANFSLQQRIPRPFLNDLILGVFQI